MLSQELHDSGACARLQEHSAHQYKRRSTTPTWGLCVSWKMVKSTPPMSQSKHVVKLLPMVRNC